ncbi:MAG: hypothetical protein NTV86_21380, partial [Planctomycetota bacterium]|nr:hypothetical protein [Planctomycetota bacterium]
LRVEPPKAGATRREGGRTLFLSSLHPPRQGRRGPVSVRGLSKTSDTPPDFASPSPLQGEKKKKKKKKRKKRERGVIPFLRVAPAFGRLHP